MCVWGAIDIKLSSESCNIKPKKFNIVKLPIFDLVWQDLQGVAPHTQDVWESRVYRPC